MLFWKNAFYIAVSNKHILVHTCASLKAPELNNKLPLFMPITPFGLESFERRRDLAYDNVLRIQPQ